VAAIGAIAFVVLAVWVLVGGLVPGDRWALVELHHLFGTSIDGPMRTIGDWTNTAMLSVVAVVVLGVLAVQARWRDALVVLVGVGMVFAANPGLKELFGRERPEIRPPPESFSSLAFPSGHASGTIALVGALVIVVHGPRLRRVVVILGAVFVGMVAFSRLVVSVHYPSDIAGGWLWAGAWVAFVALLATRSAMTRDVSAPEA
jgi:membrane-associated phospholipid phosphatase